MPQPDTDDSLQSAGREIRLYLSYAEANVVRTKVAQVLGDRAAVSRLKSITGGWAFTIQRADDSGDSAAQLPRHDRNIARMT